jgi:hypothetical protein
LRRIGKDVVTAVKTLIIAVLSFAAGFVAGVFSLWYYFMRKGVLG